MSEKDSRFTKHPVPNLYCSECWKLRNKLVQVIFCSIVLVGGNIYTSIGHLLCPECNKNIGPFSGELYQLYKLQSLDPDNREKIFI